MLPNGEGYEFSCPGHRRQRHYSVPETDRVIGVSQTVGARVMRWLVCLAPQKGRRQHLAEAPPNFSSRQCTSVKARPAVNCRLNELLKLSSE